jgi:hypothetical protein
MGASPSKTVAKIHDQLIHDIIGKEVVDGEVHYWKPGYIPRIDIAYRGRHWLGVESNYATYRVGR